MFKSYVPLWIILSLFFPDITKNVQHYLDSVRLNVNKNIS